MPSVSNIFLESRTGISAHYTISNLIFHPIQHHSISLVAKLIILNCEKIEFEHWKI